MLFALGERLHRQGVFAEKNLYSDSLGHLHLRRTHLEEVVQVLEVLVRKKSSLWDGEKFRGNFRPFCDLRRALLSKFEKQRYRWAGREALSS